MDKTPTANTRLDPAQDRYLVPGLMRGLEVLTAFTPERREMSLSEIAREIGQSRSAAFRSVYTLAQMGYLLHDEARKTYALGPAVMRLGFGYLATRELVEIALPELERLRDETDWSTHLGVRDGALVLYMLRVPSRLGLGSIVHVGSRLPAASTTMGRVLLADLDEETLIALYRHQGENRANRYSAPNMPDLMARWRADRASGTVTQIGSFEAGITSAAAPLRDMSGKVVAAINVTSASEDRREVPIEVRQALEETARRISRLLGN
ncbi:IclR family transcriptional regulator [Mameliella alba]|nr:IclR family transcriptional regulator [Antarctobacter heliothermus]MBY6146486.1 IclR family transcriptional regulator [Mameliella alba]MCA0956372.1 IclR family transcriptional regulator [Mameliella alba]